MKIHEYQAKELMAAYGVSVPAGFMAETPEEASAAAGKLKAPYIVKAQIHSGGRGKAGGVKLAHTLEEVSAISKELIGKTLVTAQTGPEGRVVRKLLIAEAAEIAKEYYFAMTIDRDTGKLAIIASAEGGVEIEQTAKEAPEKILTIKTDLSVGVRDYDLRYIADKLGITDIKGFIKTGLGMYRLFVEKDCSLVEINPLAQLDDGTISAVDAKVNFDDNALFRHPDIAALRDINEEDPKEVEAGKFDLNYVTLDGNVGCMVNGAGLAMATMDMINACGARAANFLDVGGGSNAEKVSNAFRILLSDKSVKVIFVNIFGGIVKCDMIAEGVVEAAKTCGLKLPVVARLDGTNVERGKQILRESGLNIIPADSMSSAANLCAGLVKGETA